MVSEIVKVEEQPLSPVLRVSPESIQQTVQSIALLQGMVRDVLIRGIDYGRIPSTPQDSLWDPGASHIVGAFGCYFGERRILKLEDSDQKIVACVEVPIISRTTQRQVGSGIGAASTFETKYKYRWVPNPKEWGYDEDAIKTFKIRHSKDGDEYRIPNPEYSELLNTIVKMASKRAEVDAAESLPGVASVLKQIFSGKPFRKGEAPSEEEYADPQWQRFWGETRRLGLTTAEVHATLGVTSMKDWLASGRSLDEAIAILRGSKEEEIRLMDIPAPETINLSLEESQRQEEKSRPVATKAKERDPQELTTIPELYYACWTDFGLQPSQVLKELGVSEVKYIQNIPDAYMQIRAVRGAG